MYCCREVGGVALRKPSGEVYLMSVQEKEPVSVNVQFRSAQGTGPSFFQWLKVVVFLLAIFGGMRLCSLIL
jgi:hypothetical protein